MSKVINIHTGDEVLLPEDIYHTCSICDSKFSEAEGGLNQGLIGILPVSFCPTCFSGIMEMAHHFFSLEKK